jgi:uncharacterized protein (TIGR02996 family)
MTTSDDLLRAIGADPDDQALRLVYADWLEETGDDARSEWVRLGVAIAQQGGFDLCDVPLIERRRALLREHGNVWRMRWPDWVRDSHLDDWVIPRKVHLTAVMYERNHEQLPRVLPSVRQLQFADSSSNWRDVLRSVPLPQIREIANSMDCWDDLCRSPWSPQLHRVELLELMWKSAPREPWSELRTFKGVGRGLRPKLWEWLGDASQTPRLAEVSLGGNTLSSGRLGGTSGLLRRTSLRTLRLMRNYTFDRREKDLSREGLLSLQTLALLSVDARNPNYERLLKASLPQLRELRLVAAFGDAGPLLQQLLRNESLAALERLSLPARLSGGVWRSFLESGLLARLQTLHLSDRFREPESLEMLTRSPCTDSLLALDLGVHVIEPTLARTFVESPGFQRLRRLTLNPQTPPESAEILRGRFDVIVYQHGEHVHG